MTCSCARHSRIGIELTHGYVSETLRVGTDDANHQFTILIPLAVGIGAVECTIFVHALALATTVNLLRYEKRRGCLGADASRDLAIVALVISAAFVARLIEIGLWPILFVLCEEFQELGTAYYHSAVNYRTSGYGDLLLTPGVAFAGIAGGNERSRHVRCFGCNGLCRCTAVSSGQVWDLRG
jgi:hypothetical protein